MSKGSVLMIKDFIEILERINPENAKELLSLTTNGLQTVTPATISNWIKSVLDYVTQDKNLGEVNRLTEMLNEAKGSMSLDDVGSEISNLYNCTFEFKKADLNLQTIAEMTEKPFDEVSMDRM